MGGERAVPAPAVTSPPRSSPAAAAGPRTPARHPRRRTGAGARGRPAGRACRARPAGSRSRSLLTRPTVVRQGRGCAGRQAPVGRRRCAGVAAPSERAPPRWPSPYGGGEQAPQGWGRQMGGESVAGWPMQGRRRASQVVARARAVVRRRASGGRWGAGAAGAGRPGPAGAACVAEGRARRPFRDGAHAGQGPAGAPRPARTRAPRWCRSPGRPYDHVNVQAGLEAWLAEPGPRVTSSSG